jgi:hypothetical protein
MPAIFLFLHMWRFLWVLRSQLRLSWKMALGTMYNFFSMGWAVTLASLEGLIKAKGAFLRTPKAKGDSKFWKAINSTRWETAIGLACIVVGVAGFISRPDVKTFFLAVLLSWQASLYLSATFFSLQSLGQPPRAAVGLPATGGGTAVREGKVGTIAILIGLALVVTAAVAQFLPFKLTNPFSRFQPPEVPAERLFGLENVPLDQRQLPPTATSTGTPTPTSEAPVIAPSSTPPPATSEPTEIVPTDPQPTETPAPTETEPAPTATAITPTALPPTETPTPPAPTATP